MSTEPSPSGPSESSGSSGSQGSSSGRRPRSRGSWSTTPPKPKRPSTPKAPRKPWKKPQWLIQWRRTLAILLGLLALLALLWWSYGKLRALQGRRLNQQALAYLQQGKAKEAQMSIQTALRLNPADPAALRLQASLLQSQGEGIQGLTAYQNLARSGKMTLGDLRPYATLAERQGDAKQADRLAEAAGKSNPLLGHLIRADLLRLRRQPAAAADELRKAFAENQGDKAAVTPVPSHGFWALIRSILPFRKAPVVTSPGGPQGDAARMALVDLLVSKGAEIAPGDPSKSAAEARALLKELGSRPGEAGAQALVTGLRSGIIPPAELAAWIAQLRTHPQATAEMLLLADAVAIQRDPTDKAAVVSAMVERVKNGTPEQRLAAARLLLELREPAKASSLISREEAQKGTLPFLLWMQANEMTGRHQEILAALDLPSNPLPPHLRDLYRGSELKKNKETAKGDEAFRKALADYGVKAPERTDVLIFLSAAGEQELFEKGLLGLLADPGTAEPTLRAILPGLQRQRDSAKMLRTLELAAAAPSLAGNLQLQNDLAYERLVMNLPVEMAPLAARVEANPNEFSFRVTQALALIRSGNKAQALKVLESIEADVDASKLPPRQMAVLAMAMAVNGDQEKALQLLSIAHTDQLSQQEVGLIRSVLSAPQAGSSPEAKPSPGNTPAPAAAQRPAKKKP